jgi:Na+-driven multidrug efflux pump
MTSPLDHRGFWKAYLAVLLSFVASRLLLQTDLLMTAPLGTAATAAFGVPGRLMFIDAIIVFALAPVVSVSVSRQAEEPARQAMLSQCLALTLVLSLPVTGLGLLIYPTMVKSLVADTEIRALAQQAVFWSTLSIPVRMLACMTTLGLFAKGQGQRLPCIYGLTLTANAGLDALFIHGLGLGVAGAFMATFLVSSMELTCLLVILRGRSGSLPFAKFDTAFCRTMLGQGSKEFLRLVS